MSRIATAFLVIAAASLAGCSSGSNTVAVKDDSFSPSSMTIESGESVTFEVSTQNDHPHTVTIHKAGEPTTTLLLNENVAAGDDVAFTFATSGTFHVWCTIHGQMTSGMAMVITVE